MPRVLSERDLFLLKKLAPEFEEVICSGSGLPFRSILPPVSRHFAADAGDFQRRIGALSGDDLRYLFDLIRDGSESLGCLPPDYVSTLIDRIGQDLGAGCAAEVLEIYEMSQACDQ